MQQFLAAVLADANISPAYQSAMAEQAIDQTAMPVRRAHYVAGLVRMDWTFEASDDHAVWKRGRAELERLRALRAEVDPDHTLWNRHAHRDYQHG